MLHKYIHSNLKLKYALANVYGININKAEFICKQLGINPNIISNNLNKLYVNKLIKYISDNLKIEHKLKKDIQNNLNEMKKINSTKGLRHSMNLPVHGQRTKTNAKKKNYK